MKGEANYEHWLTTPRFLYKIGDDEVRRSDNKVSCEIDAMTTKIDVFENKIPNKFGANRFSLASLAAKNRSRT